ncbi:MAG: hypothetical protein JNK53_01730 [Phycisphaerae bacterium]|nr:hypothetical protein [Phycisphaerae bacterium]
MRIASIATTLIAALALASGCEQSSGTAGAAKPSNSTTTAAGTIDAAEHCPEGTGVQGMRLPDGMVVKASNTSAVATGECKASAKKGDRVTVVGRIGGSRVPFVASQAMFTLVDAKIPSCADMGEPDHCATPWDYCCEPRENLKKNMISIEIPGADGKLLPFSVRGAEGLEPLVTVAVTGVVTERNDQGLFVVRAEKIEIQ